MDIQASNHILIEVTSVNQSFIFDHPIIR